MGALDLFSSRGGLRAGTTHTEAHEGTGEGWKPRVLVLAAARVRGEPKPAAETSEVQAVCTCGSLISRVSSLLAGRDAATCERCRFFEHYSQ